MVKKVLAVCLGLVIVLSLAACNGEPTPQEIIDSVVGAWDDVSTVRMDMQMTMEMSGESEGEELEVTSVMDYTSAMDLKNKRLENHIFHE